jgi:hypothetical protein
MNTVDKDSVQTFLVNADRYNLSYKKIADHTYNLEVNMPKGGIRIFALYPTTGKWGELLWPTARNIVRNGNAFDLFTYLWDRGYIAGQRPIDVTSKRGNS